LQQANLFPVPLPNQHIYKAIMTSVPYPTFLNNAVVGSADRMALAAVGRCRIHGNHPTTHADAYRAIVAKCIEQGSFDILQTPATEETKKLQKKYMKQGVAMASEFLKDIGLDVSVIDVEIVVDVDDVIASAGCLVSCFLDAGCDKVVLPYCEKFQQAASVARVPRERLMMHIPDVADLGDVINHDGETKWIGSVSIHVTGKDDLLKEKVSELLAAAANQKSNSDGGAENFDIIVQIRPPSSLSDNSLAELVGSMLRATKSDNTGTTISLVDPTAEQLGLCFAACCKTDRPDGLFSTVVCTRNGEALGLVYSSKESIVAALQCGRGVYYSRSRNQIWRKGDTSGHYQVLHRIDVDCDGDALRFTVTQQQQQDSNPAFCHLNTLTCWGKTRGLRHLEETLVSRLQTAPEGSYTKRLFDDEALLREKLVEEAQELSEADTAQHVAEELADVLYFAMVRAARYGVSLDDAAAELDRRSRKVTRRKGDSKEFRIAAGNAILQAAAEKKE
jgi:phosphoribosyl-ATP pyrophosphohydrolase/phosphoribosyl-AMP cyclohydrolase/histidinol dehydrogenase